MAYYNPYVVSIIHIIPYISVPTRVLITAQVAKCLFSGVYINWIMINREKQYIHEKQKNKDTNMPE